jgi:hypothetical protein
MVVFWMYYGARKGIPVKSAASRVKSDDEKAKSEPIRPTKINALP